MRVVFSAHGAFGHVLPMIGLATALQEAGHEVLFATGASLCATVSSLGLKAVPAGMSDETLVAEARRRWPESDHQPPSSWAPRMFTAIAAPIMLDDLRPIVESFHPDLVVREEGEHAAPVAATAAKIPWITHGWGSPLPTPSGAAHTAERVAPLWRAAGLAPPTDDQLYGEAALDPCPASLYGSTGPPRPVIPVRVTARRSSGVPTNSSQSGRRLAYVGFGTVPLYRDHPGLIESVTKVLLSHALDAVVTTPDAHLAARLTRLDPDHVEVRPWVQLPELLERCEIVVTHGGAGTVLAALAAGVPLLLLPRGAPSQERMSSACMNRGAAEVITDPADLDRALHSLTTEDRYRRAAREVADEIAATPGPDEIVSTLEELAGAGRSGRTVA
jgi:UDP:flavonoid glycosyltransferase YjiC (YdhE family)